MGIDHPAGRGIAASEQTPPVLDGRLRCTAPPLRLWFAHQKWPSQGLAGSLRYRRKSGIALLTGRPIHVWCREVGPAWALMVFASVIWGSLRGLLALVPSNSL